MSAKARLRKMFESKSRKAFVKRFGFTEPIRPGSGVVTESFARNGMWTAWQAGARWQKRQENANKVGGVKRLMRELRDLEKRAKKATK